MTVRLIQDAQEYREARQTLLDLVGLDPAPGTRADHQLLALASGVERYEVQHVLDRPAGARRTMVAKHGWSADAVSGLTSFCGRRGNDGGCGSRWGCTPL